MSIGSFEFLQASVPAVLLLALILMIVDTIIETKSQNKYKSEIDTDTK